MRIALFGGTFDPVHNGHVVIARAAADDLRLDRVLFIPSGRPPHKDDRDQAPYEDRYAMVELACTLDPRFKASRLEDPSRTGPGKTYSIDTIERVRKQLAPDDRLYFLLGQDAYEELDIWYRLDDVLRLVEFVVAPRPSGQAGSAGGPTAQWLTGLDNPLSATSLRRRAAADEELDEAMPPGVAAYIRSRGLYRGEPSASA